MSDTGDATAWPSPAPVSELTERGDTDSRSVAPLLRPSTRTPIALAPVAPECEGGGAVAMCTDDDCTTTALLTARHRSHRTTRCQRRAWSTMRRAAQRHVHEVMMSCQAGAAVGMSDTGDATAWPSPAPVSELTERGDTDSRSVAPLLRPSTRTPIALAPVAPECEGGGAVAMCTDDDCTTTALLTARHRSHRTTRCQRRAWSTMRRAPQSCATRSSHWLLNARLAPSSM